MRKGAIILTMIISNFTEVFKTPGKLRGKTPRTARKRNMEESRVVSITNFTVTLVPTLFYADPLNQPLSEIFSAAHNQVESKSNVSPATKRSPAKTAAPTSSTTADARPAPDNASQPLYPDLKQNLNSFPQYNTDSGYHGMADDDDVVLTQVQPESQASTQPLTSQPWQRETAPDTPPVQGSSAERRMTDSTFHSAREEREATVEPMNIDSTTHKKTEVHPPTQGSTYEANISASSESGREAQRVSEKPEKKPEQKSKQKQAEPSPAPAQVPQPQSEQEHELQHESEPEPEPEPEQEPQSEPTEAPRSSPAKTPATLPPEPHEEEDVDDDREDMALDTLDDDDDDIGSPSEGSTPERPPIRKSSLTFASLPAREPLKKSLGGPRISRTSHVDITKPNNARGSNFLGRQTGGHRTTQAALDEAQGDKMDVDDDAGTSRDNADDDTRASKQHNKSSTQRLHEKISMLGKHQPSRPTKSIPSVPGMSSAQVSYPDLPPVTKAETKPETSNRRSRETPAGEPITTDEDEWIKPLNTPQRPNLAKSQTLDIMEKDSVMADRVSGKDAPAARSQGMVEDRMAKSNENIGAGVRRNSTTPVHSPPKRPMHQKSASVVNTAGEGSTTPVGSPRLQDAPLSASKWKLQSIMKSAKGLFSNTGSSSAAAKVDVSSPDEFRGSGDRTKVHRAVKEDQQIKSSTPTKQEGRRTRSSTEREEKRRQKENEDRQREEEEEERTREQEKQKGAQLKAAQEKASQEQEHERAASVSAPSPKKIPQPQKHSSKEPEAANETGFKSGIPPPTSQQSQQKQGERRPVKPTREPLQKPKPQPVSIRVGSALSRQIPMAPGSNIQESSVPPAVTPASASKPSTLKKKTSNNSLHTASSTSSFKSSASSNTQRKAQLASERKKEQEEREARRKEEQRREVERKRVAQQQEEARRQELRSRAEAERRERERQAPEDPKKAAHMQAIEKRRLENARRLERQGSQQPSDTVSSAFPDKMTSTNLLQSSLQQPERPASQASRPASRLGSIQPFNRSVNQPQPNPAKPPKRAMDDEPSHRPAPSKPSTVQPSGETKRRRTEEEHNPPPPVRPMAPPIRQSNIRKVSCIGFFASKSILTCQEPTKPSLAGHSKPSIFNSGQPAAHQSGSSIFKTAQPQRPAHGMDMSKYASGKIPFAEPSNVAQQGTSKTPSASSSQKPPPKPSPKYPSGENINLPEIATDSEDEDSDAEMLPVPKWAQPKELENLLREQEGMEVDSIFGPIAPFSLEETFKADKKIKKFRERTSSANWSGADRLTQDEIRKDLAERQRLRLNGGWTFEGN